MDENLYKEILASSFDGVMVTDGQGNCFFVNDSYTRDTGITRDEILGHNMSELLNPAWMKTSVAIEVIEKGGAVSVEHDTKNGNHILVTGNPFFDKDGNIKMVVINTRDLSNINHLKLKLSEAQNMTKLYMKRMGLSDDEEKYGMNTVVVNARMKDIYEIATRVSSYNTTVLITGESGTGKELVARHIYDSDPVRKDKPFVVINCGAIPTNLLESELFGYEEGSFTGAVKGGKRGLIEEANHGVLFLDEIGEIEPALQVKLLRVLESRRVTRIGSSREKEVDIRIIAATNRDLEKEVQEGRFRADLYYRLNIISLKLPPLRERRDEVLPLATMFVQKFNDMYGQNKKLTFDIISEMEGYNWPGNIRELKNVVENMVVLSQNEYLSAANLPWKNEVSHTMRTDNMTLKDAVENFEKLFLQSAKERWKTTEKIGEMLSVDQSTVSRKLRKYGL